MFVLYGVMRNAVSFNPVYRRCVDGVVCWLELINARMMRYIKKTYGRFKWTMILPVVLYGCETWSLTLREERRLRVFENRVLGRVFGPKRDEVTGGMEKMT